MRRSERVIRHRHTAVSRTHHGHRERSAAESNDPAPLRLRDLPTGTGDYWIYILTNDRKSVLYIGFTSGLLRRVSQHALAENSTFSKKYHVHTLIYFENFSDPRDAIAREKQLKRWTRAKKEALIARMNPRWEDLGAVLRGENEGCNGSSSTAGGTEHNELEPGRSTALRSAHDDQLGVRS
ncbi:MAG: GIY-YIG nuclease family protein [Chthoniobacteraceae bacterium]